jgi:hypothetical protein
MTMKHLGYVSKGQLRKACQLGQAMVELVMIAPLLTVLLLGTVEIASAYNAYVTLVNATREGARLSARGNVFGASQLLMVIEEHSRGLSLETDATIISTVVAADPNSATPFVYTSTILRNNNAGASRFSSSGIQALQQSLTTTGIAAPYSAYLRKEKFVIVEVIYRHHMITGAAIPWLANPDPLHPDTILMYAYSIMPVSASS